ncbi:MAG: hypothetical protein CO012_04955 [Syntrophobacterales bacterium CG_4_8_14_3_um_filter_49_14]|nr:MAG: hypothetical protein COX52_14200 [Syntrophobacterales bacterium CG23_combo_of_CG06-09_8_20_14_all_48_27]PJA50311.1 MAG: hypothetical protein CO171_02460 [Syntrophobacterales bacterium CG_4_9_14_3_um_filter_49_8]PJC74843.1 MAG: hypothetical protein CO012_04955 [Syntrophobacterales bacterium CG_4_8_14_3_um_filter_49_14]
MAEDAAIVKETRKVRCSISERFGNDPDRYIDYLMAQEDKAKPVPKPNDENIEIDRRIETTG